jgi:hypothetical protein
MSSKRRAVVEFPIECSLFVIQKALYSITGRTKYYIKSASATMLGTSRQANGFDRIMIIFYQWAGNALDHRSLPPPTRMTLYSCASPPILSTMWSTKWSVPMVGLTTISHKSSLAKRCCCLRARRDDHEEQRQANSEDCCGMIPRVPFSDVINK